MKDLSMLVWLTQLGLSVAVPLGGFVWLAVWLRRQFGWGVWVMIVGVVLGLVFAIDGLRHTLRTMDRMSGSRKDPPVSFNDHD